MWILEPLSQIAVYKSSGKAHNKSYYKMIYKGIWDFGMLGGSSMWYVVLFWSAPIHSDLFFLICNVKHTPGKISIQLLQAHSFWLFNFFNLAGKWNFICLKLLWNTSRLELKKLQQFYIWYCKLQPMLRDGKKHLSVGHLYFIIHAKKDR